MYNLSKKDIINVDILCNKVAPNVKIDKNNLFKVLDSLHPKFKDAWILYLKLFGSNFNKYNENKLKRKAYSSPFKEFLMPIRYAAFMENSKQEEIHISESKFKQQIIEKMEGSTSFYDCDYVVIGSGAGGASVAYKLASLGFAVLIIEEGDFYNRNNFKGDPLFAFKNLYRNRGATIAFGKKNFPILAGCAVGGSTIINSGTAIKYPKYIFDEWESEYGLSDFTSNIFYDKYKEASFILNVEKVDEKYIGNVGNKVKKAADRLHWDNGPLPRNSEGCDGQGVCCFGCPTDAKRSTNVSFIPKALNNGAQILINTRVNDIIINNGRVSGVNVSFKDGSKYVIKPEKGAIISAGALFTPQLLRKSGIKNKNVGRNLSLHPSLGVFSLHKNEVNMTTSCVPQGYHVPFLPDFVLEGAAMPSPIAAVAMTSVGKEFSYIMNNYNRLLMFGALIRDTSKGYVLNNGQVLYNINKKDSETMVKAVKKLIELISCMDDVEEIYPFVKNLHKMEYKTNSSWLDLFLSKKVNFDKISSSDITLSAYHPLGSCRMGLDPSTSVIGEDYKVWNTKNLYVVDGSIFPNSTGLNPALTIQACGLMAGEIIGCN